MAFISYACVERKCKGNTHSQVGHEVCMTALHFHAIWNQTGQGGWFYPKFLQSLGFPCMHVTSLTLGTCLSTRALWSQRERETERENARMLFYHRIYLLHISLLEWWWVAKSPFHVHNCCPTFIFSRGEAVVISLPALLRSNFLSKMLFSSYSAWVTHASVWIPRQLPFAKITSPRKCSLFLRI